jgi:hypothetical protein
MRNLLDGTDAEELDEPVILTIKTKCPGKWLLADKETGEVYVPYTTHGSLQWKKIDQWDGKDA